jgi:hypothetical protein
VTTGKNDFPLNFKELSVYLSINQSINLSIYLSIYLSIALQPFVGPWRLFSFLILHRIGRTFWTGDQPVARPLPINRTQTQNKPTQIFMPLVGFEPTIPVFEQAKTIHALEELPN